MYRLAEVGRFFFAVPMVAFGVQHFAYLDFVTRVFPKLPGWIPGHHYLAFISGLFLFAAGFSIMNSQAARSTALLLGVVILTSFTCLYLPLLIITPPNGGLWTSAGKALALSGGSFLVAGSLPVKANGPLEAFSIAPVVKFLEEFIPLGRFFFAAFLILCGVEHFIYVDFVAAMVPSWIPWHIFWAYFAGVALIAGGLGMIVPMTTQLAASLSGIMIFIWFLIVHIPRAASDLSNANEMTAVFEALAMSGIAFLAAASFSNRHHRLP